MLEAIQKYFEAHNGNLDIVVTGWNTDLFNPRLVLKKDSSRQGVWGHSYVKEVRESVKLILGQWEARIHWAGEVSNSEYIAIVQNSQFLVHNVLADNGTFSVIEAAALGRPAMSSDYPQMRQLNEQFGLGLHFFDAFDIDETAKVMSELEGKPIHFNSGLQERIEKFSWHSWDETVITAINSIGSAPRKEIACL
jgi:glycosyltransferase involved in cell wall biosynthesis